MLESRIKKLTKKVKKLKLKFYKCMHINARHLGQKLTRFAIAFGTSAHTQLQGQWNVNNSVGDNLIWKGGKICPPDWNRTNQSAKIW